ncbi:MAG TPA: sigma-70 family RNA polymerase sigma factor [Woeseiaceae bacterium]|nr:sigma-70 family RNA polymerase sigma factor [Woeseiaceae bacterium]
MQHQTKDDMPPESTRTLVRLLKEGDNNAREALVRRCLPMLQRWAHGRLPGYSRDLAETDDLVQLTFIRALKNVHRFEPERQGAFLAYLRQILLNTVRDEIRRSGRRPGLIEASENLTDGTPDNVEALLQAEAIEAYESALDTLPDRQKQAIVLRVEFGLTFPEIALELDLKSANAVRMDVNRGLVKIAAAMP